MAVESAVERVREGLYSCNASTGTRCDFTAFGCFPLSSSGFLIRRTLPVSFSSAEVDRSYGYFASSIRRPRHPPCAQLLGAAFSRYAKTQEGPPNVTTVFETTRLSDSFFGLPTALQLQSATYSVCQVLGTRFQSVDDWFPLVSRPLESTETVTWSSLFLTLVPAGLMFSSPSS